MKVRISLYTRAKIILVVTDTGKDLPHPNDIVISERCFPWFPEGFIVCTPSSARISFQKKFAWLGFRGNSVKRSRLEREWMCSKRTCEENT